MRKRSRGTKRPPHRVESKETKPSKKSNATCPQLEVVLAVDVVVDVVDVGDGRVAGEFEFVEGGGALRHGGAAGAGQSFAAALAARSPVQPVKPSKTQ